jgi:hypothetical protein
MKRGLNVLLLAGFSSCSVGGTDFTRPTAALDLTGNYLLSVVVAQSCDLPVTRFEWNVVGATGTNGSNTLTMTLPGDDRRVHLVFCGSCQADPADVLGDLDTDGPPAGDAPVPDGLKLLAQLTLTGRVEARSGRGEVANGVADGTLELSRDGDEESDTLGSCASAVHSWSLSPR